MSNQQKRYGHAALFALLMILLCRTSLLAQTINRAEYFVDTDLGQGNNTLVTVPTPGSSINFSFNVNTNTLSTGFHLLGFRIRSSVTGRWSHAQFNAFYIIPPPPKAAAVNIVRGEYFIDTDPGLGNGTSITFAAAPSITTPLAISVGALTSGFHSLVVRYKDNNGRWSHGHTQSFYIVPPTTQPNAASIVAAEYFIDTDLGNGLNTALPVTPGNPLGLTPAITLNNLTPGFHKMGIRYRDNLKQWSHAEIRTFYVVDGTLLAPANIVAAEYFVDADPGVGLATNIPGITPGSTVDQLVALDMTGVPTGSHTLNIRVQDSRGFWSYITTANFSVSACIPPTPPTAPPVSRCDAGTVMLTASGASGAQVYRWYDDPVLNNLVGTGTSFTTPSLSASKNYYVSTFDPATSCESSRTTTSANVTIIPTPVVNPSGAVSFCEGSSIFLSAPTGYSQYAWSNGQTTQQVLITTAGDYTVQMGDGTCLSAPSSSVTVSVIPSLAKPTIDVAGSTTICGTGTVDLSGPDGLQYLWSNGATTQTITASQTGVYYLITRTTSGSCPSLPSDPVVVTLLAPPCGGGSTNEPPVIGNDPLATPIEGTVTLDLTTIITDPDNNIDYTTLTLIGSTTARGAPATVDATYNLQINYSGMPFTGTDRITIEVCDLAGACVQQVLDIDVVGAVVVYNGITPDGDGKNDFLLLKYIDVIEGGTPNKVTILNRWGDVVFDMTDYNNTDRVFVGQSTKGGDLPSGTYFYRIEFTNSPTLTGFLTLLR